jgi:hypothetical protein
MNLSVIVLSLVASMGLGLAGVHAALSIVFWLVQRKPATLDGTGSMR